MTQAWWSHETAIVEEGAQVGNGTRIWHHVHVRAGAVVGSNCTLGKNVFIDAAARLGDGVKIQNNVSVYSGVHLGDGVFIGPSAVFTNDLLPRADSSTWQVMPTLVEDGVSIGANATIVCNHKIGHHAMVAAGSVVTHDVPPHALVMGNPARIRGWVCACGAVIGRSPKSPPSIMHCERCRGTDADRQQDAVRD